MDNTKDEHTRALNLDVRKTIGPSIFTGAQSHIVGNCIDSNTLPALTSDRFVFWVSRAGIATHCDAYARLSARRLTHVSPTYERQRIDP